MSSLQLDYLSGGLKMSKAFKAASSTGAAALVLSGAAMAAPPISFDQWSVTSGDITVDISGSTCPSGWTCSNPITGDGFYQRQISDGSNDYFQTIITDKGSTCDPGAANCTFADESYVQTGNNSGLADKSQINDSTTTGTLTESFSGSVALLTGWAENGNGDEVQIYQGLGAVDTAAEDFRTDFWLQQFGASGANGKIMRISSAVDIEDSSGASQDFVLVDRSGTAAVNAGSVDLGADGTLSWLAGENVKATWVGQDMSNVADVNQEFGFTAYENLTTPGLVDAFSLSPGSSSAPIDWDTSAPPVGWGPYTAGSGDGPF